MKLRVLILFAFLSFPLRADNKATQVFSYNFDIDDNAFFLPTKVLLLNKLTGKEEGISTGEFAKIRPLLGSPNGGKWKDFEVSKNAYKYFGDESEQGIDLFKNTLLLAMEGKESEWMGPSFNALIHALEKEKTAKEVTFITAREHSPRAILKGLVVLQEYMWRVHRKIIYVPEEKNIFPVAWKGLPKEFQGNALNPSESKAKVMLSHLDRITNIPLTKNGLFLLNQEGTQSEILHHWGFSDDDLGNFNKAVEVLTEAVKEGKYKNIKITLFYTGKNTPETLPHSVVIRKDGSLRATVMGESLYTYVAPAQTDQDFFRALSKACSH